MPVIRHQAIGGDPQAHAIMSFTDYLFEGRSARFNHSMKKRNTFREFPKRRNEMPRKVSLLDLPQ